MDPHQKENFLQAARTSIIPGGFFISPRKAYINENLIFIYRKKNFNAAYNYMKLLLPIKI